MAVLHLCAVSIAHKERGLISVRRPVPSDSLHMTTTPKQCNPSGRITVPSLERWEVGYVWPRKGTIMVLCELYGKTPEELGFDKARDIMPLQSEPYITATSHKTPLHKHLPTEGEHMSTGTLKTTKMHCQMQKGAMD